MSKQSTEIESLVIDVNAVKTIDVSLGEVNPLSVDLSKTDVISITDMQPTGGAKSYNKLLDKPSINDVVLVGNKTGEQLHLQDKMESLSNLEIERLLG